MKNVFILLFMSFLLLEGILSEIIQSDILTFDTEPDTTTIESITDTTTDGLTEETTNQNFTEETTTEFDPTTEDPDSNTIESVTDTTQVPSSSTSIPSKPVTSPSSKRNPIINIEEGALRGIYKKGFYHFMGIRYGQAPIGEKRFKPALPEPAWTGIRSALKFGSACPHIQLITQLFMGNEDCLFLNVFAKTLPSDMEFEKPLPVMVWLHGGAFKAGSGNFPLTGPDFLVNEGVIVVTLNYRLGALGFLCVDENARGNMGIQDQILALKWVKRNIAAFGGDPDKVTIFGFSAGAVSVDILMLSEAAKGLFNNAIAQSGSVLAPWSFVQNPREQAFRLGQQLGYKGENSTELVEFLRKTPTILIVERSVKMNTPEDERNALSINFTPCIESQFENSSDHEPIITEEPLKTLMRGNYTNVPYIGGFNADEGILIFKNILMDPKATEKFKKSDMYFIPSNINITNIDKAEVDLIAQDISHIYLGLKKDNNRQKVADAMVKYGTDVFFLYGMTRTLRYHLRNGNKNVRAYRFAFDGALNFYKKFVGYTGPGAAHGDELGYLFTAPSYMYLGMNLNNMASREVITKNRMVKMWTNFAKFSDPTPSDSWNMESKWNPIENEDNFSYFDISDELNQVNQMPHQDRVDFWDEVYHEYNKRSSNQI
uniref:Carboxylic ester hydrolase n=1 Tax=Culicoides sonorensis TaxID=179676 RepID=A0A336L0F2_CULSO